MKQKHSIRLLAGLVALTLCICPLAGCGDKANRDASDKSTASAAETGTASVQKGVICKDTAFVRSTPGLAEDNKLGDLKKNTPVVVLGEVDGWYKIQYENSDTGCGYVSIGYIEITSSTPAGTGTGGDSADGSAAPSVIAINQSGTVMKKGVIVRSQPEIDEKTRLGSLKKGTSVNVIEQTGDWYKIEYKSTTGFAYVSSQYISLEEKNKGETTVSAVAAEGFTPLSQKLKGTVNDTGVYVRKSPDTEKDTRLKMMEKGASVTILAQSDTWYQIEYKTSSGVAYIAAKYVTISGNTANASPTFTNLSKKTKGTVLDSGVYVRRSPNSDKSSRIELIKKGASVTVVAQADGWYKITYNTTSGYAYIASQFVYLPSDTSGFVNLEKKVKGTVNDNGVYVRKSPDTSAQSKIKMLEKGSAVTVVAQSGSWYKIAYSGTSSGYAYVASQFVTLPTDTSGFTNLPSKVKGTVNDTGVYVRRAPDTSASSRIKLLEKGSSVTVVAQSGSWYKIAYSGTSSGYAYVAAQYITLSSSVTASPDSFVDLPKKVKGTVAKNGVYVRKSPDTSNSSRIKMLTKGTAVTVVAQSSEWYKVEYNTTSGYGYIAAQLLTLPDSAVASNITFTALDKRTKATVTKNGVFVRSSPDTSEKTKLATLKKNAVVTVIATSENWAKIEYNNTAGYAYISAQYISFGSDTDTPAQNANTIAANTAATITKNGVFVRSAPNTTEASKLGTLKKGTTVTVLAKEGDWYKIQYNTAEGYAYVSAQFVAKKETANSSLSDKEKKTNAEYWQSYARSYARNIGLTVKNDKEGGMDSSIPVESPSTNATIRKAIAERLDGYRKNGVTTVRFWITNEYNSQWELFIAYS